MEIIDQHWNYCNILTQLFSLEQELRTYNLLGVKIKSYISRNDDLSRESRILHNEDLFYGIPYLAYWRYHLWNPLSHIVWISHVNPLSCIDVISPPESLSLIKVISSMKSIILHNGDFIARRFLNIIHVDWTYKTMDKVYHN